MIDGFTEKMDESYGRYWDYHLRVLDGIYDLFNELVDRGISIVINTNKMDDKTKRIVEELFHEYNFVDVIGKRADVPNKPDPFAAKRIMEKAKVDSEETIYVGDSQYDVETGINAGTIPIAVTWGYRDKKDLQKAKYLLEHPLDLFKYIK